MFSPLGEVTLKSGERVPAAVIRGPDEEWRERISRLLGHKGDIWRWQNTELLTRETGIDAWFYVLHRSGMPLAHVMTAELYGVGIFGHVWTEPADRGQGASGKLIALQMAHFRQRGGRALFLNTDPNSPAFALYQRHGFAAIESGSGAMDYIPDGRARFESEWFAPGPVHIEPANWRHWPTAPALFMADIPGFVRCAPLSLFGRQSSEEALLPWIQNSLGDQVYVARSSNGAVVGMAARSHVHLPDVRVDVFCHPQFWNSAGPLLDAVLRRAPAGRRLAHADKNWPEKHAALLAAGFTAVDQPSFRQPVNDARTRFVEVVMYSADS